MQGSGLCNVIPIPTPKCEVCVCVCECEVCVCVCARVCVRFVCVCVWRGSLERHVHNIMILASTVCTSSPAGQAVMTTIDRFHALFTMHKHCECCFFHRYSNHYILRICLSLKLILFSISFYCTIYAFIKLHL